jgi:hypothetical protein
LHNTKKITGNKDDWKRPQRHTMNTVATSRQGKQEEDPAGRLKKHRNGHIWTAGDFFAKVEPQEWK